MRVLLVALLLVVVAAAPGIPAKPPVDADVVLAEGDGRLLAGLLVTGVGVAVPGGEPWNVARFPFTVDDCHRDLRLQVDYTPRNVSVDASAAYLAVPHELQIRLVDADTGERFPEATFRVLSPGTFAYPLSAPANVTAELWLSRGVNVSYEFRVTGRPALDAECRHQGNLFVNEKEMGPPTGSPQWVEVHNGGLMAVTLTNWTLRAASGGTHAIGSGVSVPVGGFTVIDLPDGFLDAEGDRVFLHAPRGWEVDATPFLADEAGDDSTWQRATDGGDLWAFREGTPGATNG